MKDPPERHEAHTHRVVERESNEEGEIVRERTMVLTCADPNCDVAGLRSELAEAERERDEIVQWCVHATGLRPERILEHARQHLARSKEKGP